MRTKTNVKAGLSFCIVLLMFLLIPTARAQEARREPTKPDGKKSQEVKPINESLKKEVKAASQHHEPARSQARLQKQSVQPHRNPDGTVSIEGADKYVEKNEDESSYEHHHHSDAECDKFIDLAAKKKCEDFQHIPVKKN